MKCAIIGAGMSALACADVLVDAGNDVVLFDKGRGPGGRMSSRVLRSRFGKVDVDHGAPCFDVVDPGFREVVANWRRRGLVAPWPPGGRDAWIGVPRMASIVADMSARHRVMWHTFVDGLLRDTKGRWMVSSDHGRHGPFDAVIVATPAEQAIPILALHDFEMAQAAARAFGRPCWTGLFTFAEAVPVDPGPYRDHAVIALAVANRAKSGSSRPEAWVVHALPEWSARHLELAADEVAPLLLTALGDCLGVSALPDCDATAHRWRYALYDSIGRQVMWNCSIRLGACGDWLLGAHVECAWLSGRHLAGAIVAMTSAASRDGPQRRARRAAEAVGSLNR